MDCVKALAIFTLILLLYAIVSTADYHTARADECERKGWTYDVENDRCIPPPPVWKAPRGE